jgi:hypothetical protein
MAQLRRFPGVLGPAERRVGLQIYDLQRSWVTAAELTGAPAALSGFGKA